jgi:hypothetical protein
MNRRGTSPTRQQAGVNIQATPSRQIKNGLRQNQSIRRDHHHIRGERRESRLRRLGTQTLRLIDRQTVRQRPSLDRTGLRPQAPTSGPVGLSQDTDNGEAGCRNRFECSASKLRSPGKNHAQWRPRWVVTHA